MMVMMKIIGTVMMVIGQEGWKDGGYKGREEGDDGSGEEEELEDLREVDDKMMRLMKRG